MLESSSRPAKKSHLGKIHLMLAALFDPDPVKLAIRAIAVISALTFHEFAHAWAAYRAGDETAYRMGRLSLNPLVHLDPLGTIMLFFGPIGWAKPVPVNPANYRNPRRDDILVSVAGVSANALLALFWTAVYSVIIYLQARQGVDASRAIQPDRLLPVLESMAFWGMFINVALAVFNLLPIPPLDGSHVLAQMLKGHAALRYAQLQRYGLGFLIAFIIFNRFVPVLGETIIFLLKPLIHLAITVAKVALRTF